MLINYELKKHSDFVSKARTRTHAYRTLLDDFDSLETKDAIAEFQSRIKVIKGDIKIAETNLTELAIYLARIIDMEVQSIHKNQRRIINADYKKLSTDVLQGVLRDFREQLEEAEEVIDEHYSFLNSAEETLEDMTLVIEHLRQC